MMLNLVFFYLFVMNYILKQYSFCTKNGKTITCFVVTLSGLVLPGIHRCVECNHFAQERKDVFGRTDVVESFRFHPTLILIF